MPSNPVKVNRRFVEAHRLLLQGQKSKRSSYCLLHIRFLFRLPFDPEDGDNIFRRNIGFYLTTWRYVP
jgi:hypothetical protein